MILGVPLVDSVNREVSYWVDIAEYDLETAYQII
jgi:hypothetical protein